MPHSRLGEHLALVALLSFLGASKISGSLKKEIIDDIDTDRKSHFKGICNPNNLDLGMKVKFMSGRCGWRVGVLVAILGNDDGRVCLKGNKFVTRKLYLLFPVR